jgi:amylosucrase
VLGYLREHDAKRLLVLGNFSEVEQTVSAPVLSALPENLIDLIGNSAFDSRQGITLAPYQMLWLECRSPA